MADRSPPPLAHRFTLPFIIILKPFFVYKQDENKLFDLNNQTLRVKYVV